MWEYNEKNELIKQIQNVTITRIMNSSNIYKMWYKVSDSDSEPSCPHARSVPLPPYNAGRGCMLASVLCWTGQKRPGENLENGEPKAWTAVRLIIMNMKAYIADRLWIYENMDRYSLRLELWEHGLWIAARLRIMMEIRDIVGNHGLWILLLRVWEYEVPMFWKYCIWKIFCYS